MNEEDRNKGLRYFVNSSEYLHEDRDDGRVFRRLRNGLIFIALVVLFLMAGSSDKSVAETDAAYYEARFGHTRAE